jgi:hypothetical protein
MAGWWLYGVCCQIGAFAYDGSWMADPETGRIVKTGKPGVRRNFPELVGAGRGVNRPQLREPGVSRARPHLSAHGMGVNRPQLREPGVNRARPHLSAHGMGVNHAGLREPGVRRARPHLGSDGQGVNRPQLREPGVSNEQEFHPRTMPELRRWMAWLSARLRHVRILQGDWSRVCTDGVMKTIPVDQGGHCGVFVDPPYDLDERAKGLYGHDSDGIAGHVREWCLKKGSDPNLRIVLAGFDTEHQSLESEGWTCHEWFKAGYLRGGMGEQAQRERLWSSPHCLSLAEVAKCVWE